MAWERTSAFTNFCDSANLLSQEFGTQAINAVAINIREPVFPEKCSSELDRLTFLRNITKQIVLGEQKEVVLTLFENGDVEVGEYSAEWVDSLILNSVYLEWGRITVDTDKSIEIRSRSIAGRSEVLTGWRRKKYMECRRCGKRWIPPEWRDNHLCLKYP